MKRALLVVFVGGLLASPVAEPGIALAETPPTGWDRARDPAVGERYQLHLRMQQTLQEVDSAHPREKEQRLQKARTELELASAATSPDVRLRYDLGQVYYALERFDEAIQVLEPALKLAPGGSGCAEAWLALAFAAAKTDRSRLELDAYDAYLAVALREHSILNILSNRAEAEMRLGNLDEAVAGYRDVIERIEHSGLVSMTEYQTLVLARWGLAVALDRNGNPAESEQVAFVASEQDPQEKLIGDQENVFFVPKYERDWYFALGRTQHARRALEPRVALLFWNLVEQTWASYVASAVPSDRWLALARAHLAAAQVERRSAAARYSASQPKGSILPAPSDRHSRPHR